MKKIKYNLYEVGGKIRDELLGLKSNDVDYAVTLPENNLPEKEAFDAFVSALEIDGFKIRIKYPDRLTVKAKFPDDHAYSGDADFVIARKEIGYIDGTRIPITEIGTLEDDLFRRDFTVNALTKGEDGKIIDMFGGLDNLNSKLLRTPGETKKSFTDDPLRIIRAIRFCITKGFTMDSEMIDAIRMIGLTGIEVVSKDRIRDEINKCFAFDSKLTMKWLFMMENDFGFSLMSYIFDETGLWITLTDKKK